MSFLLTIVSQERHSAPPFVVHKEIDERGERESLGVVACIVGLSGPDQPVEGQSEIASYLLFRL